jgi:hypothetical protein
MGFGPYGAYSTPIRELSEGAQAASKPVRAPFGERSGPHKWEGCCVKSLSALNIGSVDGAYSLLSQLFRVRGRALCIFETHIHSKPVFKYLPPSPTTVTARTKCKNCLLCRLLYSKILSHLPDFKSPLSQTVL